MVDSFNPTNLTFKSYRLLIFKRSRHRRIFKRQTGIPGIIAVLGIQINIIYA